MKLNILSKLSFSMALLVLLIGCASAPRVQETSKSEDVAVITGVRLSDNSLSITSNKPFIYTLYSANDPYKITLDIPDIGAGAFTNKIVSDKAGITEVTPQQIDSPPGVKFTIIFQNPSSVAPVYGDNTLTLVIKPEEAGASAKSPETVKTYPPSESAGDITARDVPPAQSPGDPPPQPQDEAPVKAPAGRGDEAEVKMPDSSTPPMARATEISRIEIKKAMDTVKVSITGNGSMRPNVFPLNERIVVDIPGVVMKASVPSGTAYPLKGIRAGKYKDKVRLVLDLRGNANYDVESQGNSIEISLGRKALAETKTGTKTLLNETSAETALRETPPPAPAIEDTTAAKAPAHETTTRKIFTAEETPASNAITQRDSFTGKKISLDFQDAEVGPIFRLLADVNGYNLVLDPGVKGKITIKLMNVPWDQALDIILNQSHLSHRLEGNILWIAPNSVFEAIVSDKAKAREATEKAEPLVQEIIQINYAEAESVSKAIGDAKLLSPRGNITKDNRMNTLIIKDTQKSIEKIRELVKVMDVTKPQVMIEAKLVQVSNDYSESFGIRWGGSFSNPSWPTPIGGNLSVNTPTAPAGSAVTVPGGALGLTVGHANTLKVDLSLSALESIGKSKTLSNPKVLTMDNEKATIQQGSTFYISTVSQAGTQTTAQTATLSLEVTPKITPDGYIQLKVTATDNALVSVTPLPVVDTKSMTTQALVKNGETLVLGGIYTTTVTENEDAVPGLGRIPGLGWLFKTKTVVGPTTKELLIFITPTVISQQM